MHSILHSLQHMHIDNIIHSRYQDFWFHLSKKEAQQFASLIPTLSGDKLLDDEICSHGPVPKLSIAVYANNISTNIIAMATIPLKDLIISVSLHDQFMRC